MASGFEEDALVAVLDLLKLALLTPTKGVLGKVSDGCEHAADELRILSRYWIARNVPQQEPCLAVDEKYLSDLKGERGPQGHLGLGGPTQARADPPPHCPRVERATHLGVHGAGQIPDRLRNRADDELADDGIQGLDHLFACVTDLAADRVAQHR